ncbi:MAG: peptide deformylase, partial [Holosporaceae bacterium]|nr:peptide deformylase [Holosporaceae bacterium]
MRDNICLQSIVGNPRSVVVVEYPAKVLRKKALLLTESDRTYLPAVLNIMEEKMKAHNGIGLAAPQIGLSKR